MIYNVFLELKDPRRLIHHHCVLDSTGNEVAVADNCGSDNRLNLYFSGKTYHFPKKLTGIEKEKYSFPYPFSPNIQKTFGTSVISNNKVVLNYYREAATYKKVLFLKHNFIFNVYQYNGNVYHCYKVGFADSNSHFYCLKTTEGETAAIIERHSHAKDQKRGTIYLKDESLLELVVLVTAGEIMMLQLDIEDSSRIHDPSAGYYVSVSDAEKAMYDKDFIPAVKAMHGIYD